MVPDEATRHPYDVLTVIDRQLPLTRVDSVYCCSCPFHSERTMSFYVYPEHQRWWCGYCQLGGNVVDFVARYHLLSLPEAVALLAKEGGSHAG